jgi:hypothetical protein
MRSVADDLPVEDREALGADERPAPARRLGARHLEAFRLAWPPR